MNISSGGAATLRLAVRRAAIRHGGYLMSYSGEVPAGATLWLGVPDPTNALEVTGKSPHQLLDQSNLPKFLALIGARKWWGARGECKLIARQGGTEVATSEPMAFHCPVKPLVSRPGTTTPKLGLSLHELYGLTYAGDNNHGSFGRHLYLPAIDGCYYFRNGHDGMFETDNTKRGLVCTSYVAAVWGIVATPGGPMTWTGTRIAANAGAPFFCKDLGMKNKPSQTAKEFLLAHPRGTYLVGAETHIALVVNGTVHDFTIHPRRGYNERPVSVWHPSASHLWTIGQPQKQF